MTFKHVDKKKTLLLAYNIHCLEMDENQSEKNNLHLELTK